jgi:hypothetical protein
MNMSPLGVTSDCAPSFVELFELSLDRALGLVVNVGNGLRQLFYHSK